MGVINQRLKRLVLQQYNNMISSLVCITHSNSGLSKRKKEKKKKERQEKHRKLSLTMKLSRRHETFRLSGSSALSRCIECGAVGCWLHSLFT